MYRSSFQKKLLLCICSLIGLVSCTKDETSLEHFPEHFPKPYLRIDFDESKFKLGKKLFYDPIFSKDSSISCASCHSQDIAFSDSRVKSIGVDGKIGRRNSMPLQNLIWTNSYFWDGGVGNLDLAALNPINNHDELDESILHITEKINRNGNYKSLIEESYQKDTISHRDILDALLQFQAQLISNRSKFDQFIQSKISFNPAELAGYQIFQNKCGHCHAGVLQSDNSFRNNGVYKMGDSDLGRYEISVINSDKGKFKVPSLRNIALTAPYMHDGNLKTLESVLDHYQHGINQSPSLDSSLKNSISLTASEKKNIISFLHTLTDSEFISNTRFKP